MELTVIMFMTLSFAQTEMSAGMGATCVSFKTSVEITMALTRVSVHPATLWMQMDTVAMVHIALSDLVDLVNYM